MWTFLPILKPTLWGGEEILKFKGLPSNHKDIGESWEIADIDRHQSMVATGPDAGITLRQLVKKYKEQLVGAKNYQRFGDRFPLLIKFIDAKQDLSVQVHPDDEAAEGLGLKNGKTEMWYVVKAGKGARIISGLHAPVDQGSLRAMTDSGDILNLLQSHDVAAGEAFFIPGGRIHTIGAGTLLCEIQQSADITYRLYDFHRKGPNGKERALQVEEAIQVAHLDDTDSGHIDYPRHRGIPVNLVTSPHFCANLLETDGLLLRDYSEWDTFVVLIATHGEAVVTSRDKQMTLTQGSCVLIPACSPGIKLEPKKEFTAIETYIK